ncbi:GNAT family N-acetyltransferase [Massilia sp. Dwa41.01b]|uniref:GNAT family N-acetyltransferase n=1 Tax=Massilia sp. Dwa41.01b TaxID=2709302 RepID=UPI001E3068CE|nr:GNAT family N-acetyltransferase [Massilia sp. Dwa41.01b]
MISLRKAMPGEIAALWDLRTRAVAHGCAGHYTPEVLGVWLAAPAPASLADRIALGQAMAAVEDGALLGYAVLDTREGEVDAVFVDPDAQGRGVGLSLLASVEAARAHHGPDASVPLGFAQRRALLPVRRFHRRARRAVPASFGYRHPVGLHGKTAVLNPAAC